MGVPQILVIIWCVIGFFWKLGMMAKHADDRGLTVAAGMVAVLFHLLLVSTFQLLLVVGGFYG